ncbi:hypothetical protein F5876DRAFT_78752 [Lentinula aff. lateritia]|uniref:Uncharacterized protein n=1 Tax=Lentinula aff. lateritia TaxID=2804960 RepID=A0ACC1TUI6_9AGAR|nr:hypothetical protein F5876DRAFT_78752 [Lentinula aff. lateritia]
MLPLSVLTKTGVRGAVFKYHFSLLCGLLIILFFTASTTAIPFAAASQVGQRDADNALSSAQQLTASKLLSPRDRDLQTLQVILRFHGELPLVKKPEEKLRQTLVKATRDLGTNLVKQLLTTASHVLDPICRKTIFEVNKVIGYPTNLGDREEFSVSFVKQGPCRPEYDLYQGWISWTDSTVTGEIRTAGVKTLVARVENGNLVYPKVFHIPFELGIWAKISLIWGRRNKSLNSDTKLSHECVHASTTAFRLMASTTAIPFAAPVNVKIQESSSQEFNPFQSSWAGQTDVGYAISFGAQQSTVSKLLEIRGQKLH